MRKERGITLVSLVVTIIVLIILAGVSINLLLGENGIITKAKEAKRAQEIAEIKEKLSLEIAAAETDAIIRNENLEQRQLEDIVNKYGTLQEDKDTIITKKNNYEISLKEIWYGVLSESGSYTDKVKQIEILEKELAELKAKYEELEQINEGNTQILEDLRNQITRLEEEKRILEENLAKEQEKTRQQEEQIAELNNIKTKLANVTVTEDKILKDYIAYKDGKLIIGTMTDNGAVKKSLNAGGSYTIPAGYHNGSGKVTANSLASQTQATATASDIMSGKTAWVNGSLITGKAASSKTPKFIGFFYYRYKIAGAYFIYNTESNTIGINSKTCDNFKFVDSSDVETIQILKSGYFDIIATGKGAEQYKLMNQYIEANTTYSVPCGNYAGGEGMIVIYSY